MAVYIENNNQDEPVPAGKKIFLVGMLVLLVLLIYLVVRDMLYLAPFHPPLPADKQALPVASAPVAAVPAATHQIPIGFRVGGRIDKVLVPDHANVKKGDVIATLDKRPFEQALASAQAQLQLAQAEYENSLHIPTSNFNAIEAARANVETAQHVYDGAHEELEKRRSIMVAGQLDHVYKDDVQNEKDAELALQRARRALAQEEDVSGNFKGRSEYKAAVQAATVNLSIAEANLADTQLIAPVDGTVISHGGEEGAIVQPDTPLYVISASH